MKSTMNPARHREAFTLVELLCVTGILLLLIALFLPALDAARDRSVTTSCQNNQRQLWIGFQMYCTENNGAFACEDPWQSPGAPTFWPWHKRWTQAPWLDLSMYAKDKYLAPFVGTNVWIDPGMPETAKKARPYGYGISSVFSRAYGNSSYRFGKTITSYQGYGPVSLAELPSPATTAIFACKIGYTGQNLYSAGGSGGCQLTMGPEAGQAWALHGPWFMPGVRTKTNVARVDGSVRTYDTREIVLNGPSVYGIPYGPPYWLSSLRHYLWTGWSPNVAGADPELVGTLKE